MITSKQELLKKNPNDFVLLPVTKTDAPKVLDLKENLNFLTLTFPDKKERFALILSSEEDIKRFYELEFGVKVQFCFRPVKIQDLFAILMVNHFHLLVDPFGDMLVTLSPYEMCDYCIAHQEEIYEKKSFENPAYVNFRVVKAKKNGNEEKKKLLKDLIQFGVFYVATPPGPIISPCISQIGYVDQRRYLMLFSLESIAARFCNHFNHGKELSKNLYVPTRVTVKELGLLTPQQTGASMIFLNDGAEGLAFSYEEFMNAIS